MGDVNRANESRITFLHQLRSAVAHIVFCNTTYERPMSRQSIHISLGNTCSSTNKKA